MAICDFFSRSHDEIATWRRHLHSYPELLYEVHQTAAFVTGKLRDFGVDKVATHIGRTGVVGVIEGRSTASGRVIGLRADMDALPIQEAVDRPHRSKIDNVMHACGHDGHTAMLLGAAKYLARTRDFDGTVVVIFQPAEEGGAGARAMIEDGLIDRFGIDQFYGLHNMPGIAANQFAICEGSFMAAADMITIDIEGFGAHAAKPNLSVDPVVVGAAIVQAVQTIASRNVRPRDSVVVSITKFEAGQTYNIIPQTARLLGTVRSLTPEVRTLAETRLERLVTQTAAAYGARASVTYEYYYPITVNHGRQTAIAAAAARDVVGRDCVDDNAEPSMGAEDFSFMLQHRPGAFIFLGQGDTAGLHHPAYDFNDEIIPAGCSYLARLAESTLSSAQGTG